MDLHLAHDSDRSVADAPEAAEAQVHPSVTPTRPHSIGSLHRTVSLLAAISLFLGTVTSYNTLIWAHVALGLTIMVGYAGALLFAALAVSVRGRRAMLRVDIGILVTSLAVRMPTFLASFHSSGLPYANDEGALSDFGAGLLRHGIDPYTQVWTNAYAPGQPGITQTMAGGVVDHFDYPPLTAIWATVAHAIAPGLPSAALAATAALLATTVLLFVLLPTPWRSAASLLGIGLGFYLMPFARQGYPEMLALPFLIVAVRRWTRIGAGGRLGRLGVTSALCLGMAISTHQLAWFLAPFLVVGILMCRLGDQPRSDAWRLVGRYCLIAGGVFAAINAPFVVWNAGAWWTAVRTPITVATVPHGQGLIAISYYLFGGSGGLQYFGYASAALAAGLLACFALFIRRVGPTMAILPWATFLLSTRSSDKYFYIMMPVWLMCLASVPLRDFARAYAPAWRVGPWRPLNHAAGRAFIVIAAFAPTVALLVAAIGSPQPLQMAITGVTTTRTSLISQITVEVRNTSTQPISPHFALSNSQAMSRFWTASSGPSTLEPQQTAVFVLVPTTPGSRRNIQDSKLLLRAVSATPETLSSVAIPHGAATSP